VLPHALPSAAVLLRHSGASCLAIPGLVRLKCTSLLSCGSEGALHEAGSACAAVRCAFAGSAACHALPAGGAEQRPACTMLQSMFSCRLVRGAPSAPTIMSVPASTLELC
jgi:hypothetical protein